MLGGEYFGVFGGRGGGLLGAGGKPCTGFFLLKGDLYSVEALGYKEDKDLFVLALRRECAEGFGIESGSVR